jgi:predicted RND superfamily exporter protein
VSDTYIPGTCNLGKAEVRRRQFVAFLGLALSLFSAFGLWQGSTLTRATIFLPLFVFAVGYVAGAFNLGRLGELSRVQDPADRAADRKTALSILGQAALLALVLTLLYLAISA